ncbi:transmembrane protein 167a [Vairimorpha ceranae]|uniref:Protein kish n=1 Tax=Vairimorpha ceranae TaxID=40302 RepID=A0A0F9YSJ2_9MICR|nr:transmembrane protein 167a [Vairimorpha ceranae]KKO75507.1 transmembrane protein 167a [Vairimorpha ceranae]
MSALFHFDSCCRLIILLICTVTYIKIHFPSWITNRTKGIPSTFYKLSVIGERLSIYVAFICLLFGIKKLVSIII